jgi:Fe-S cluster assembly protein SufD
MTALATKTSFTQESFDAFLAARNEPQWLTDLRRSCWQAYEAMPLPGRQDEEWARTDIRTFRFDRFHLPTDATTTATTMKGATAAAPPPAALTAGVELAGAAVALDSRPHSSRLDPKWAARGVLFGSLDELVREHGDRIRPHLFAKAVNPRQDKFAALHAALWSGSFLLYVPRGVAIDQPLHTQSAMTDGGVDFGHTLVILEEGAEATMLAETASDGPAAGGLHCGAIELLVGPGARLRYVNLQDWGSGVWHFAHQKAVVDRDASIQWTIGALGAKLAHVRQHVALVGEGADAQVNGVMFTEGKQHLSYQTLQHHCAPHCHSDLLYKGGLQDKSRVVWRGMIKVDPAAQKTDGYQRNDNLMLSADARSDSIPGLEIEADDVRCTHGSTSGRVDEELIYYAQARGLTRNEAVRLVVTGFFQQVFDRITIESVREALGHAIRRRVREIE